MASEQKTIRLFLASSDELKNERNEFEKLIRRKNKSWKIRGVYLELEIWEDSLEAMSLHAVSFYVRRVNRGRLSRIPQIDVLITKIKATD